MRYPHERHGDDLSGNFGNTWCHGSGGIALAHITAARNDAENGGAHVTLAKAALTVTAGGFRDRRYLDGFDASLCHGNLGLCEVLNLAGEMVFGDDFANIGADMADALLSRHGHLGDWVTDPPGHGQNPSLLMGIFGIGHCYLRLAHPRDVAPILLLR